MLLINPQSAQLSTMAQLLARSWWKLMKFPHIHEALKSPVWNYCKMYTYKKSDWGWHRSQDAWGDSSFSLLHTDDKKNNKKKLKNLHEDEEDMLDMFGFDLVLHRRVQKMAAAWPVGCSFTSNARLFGLLWISFGKNIMHFYRHDLSSVHAHMFIYMEA